MQSKLVAEALVSGPFSPGRGVLDNPLAVKEQFSAAPLTALGAFSEATVGWFDLAGKTYRKIPVAQQCEVTERTWRHRHRR
jgi:hypothetical protein